MPENPTTSPRRTQRFRRSPLGWQRAELAKGLRDPRKARTVESICLDTFGDTLGAKLIRLATHAHFATAEGDGGRPRSAKLFVSNVRLRHIESRCARRFVGYALAIAEWQRPWGQRWRGQSVRLYLPALAASLGLEVRQLARYLCALRTTGIVEDRQPPPVDGKQQYAVYEWREMPAELGALLRRREVPSSTPSPPAPRSASREATEAFRRYFPPS